MTNVLTQEDIGIFGSDPSTIKEKPSDALYANGVEVQYTAPAKWWNWLWNAVTGWFNHHKADNQSIIAEETNLLSAAGEVPTPSDSHQLTDSFTEVAEACAEDYDMATVIDGGVERPVNRPYVSGMTIVLPDTELL